MATRSPERALLVRTANLWHTRVSTSLRRHGIRWFQNSPKERIRLLNWKVWCLRYHISIDWLVDRILDIYSKARRNGPESLGLSIAMVTGEKAHGWVLQCIQREFPVGENLDVYRSALQAKMMGLPTKIRTRKEISVESYIREYRKNALELRNRSLTEPGKFQRPWRGNPWR